MKGETIGLIALGGLLVGGVGFLIYEQMKNPASPAAQTPTPAPATGGGATEVSNGVALTDASVTVLTVPIGTDVLISIPSGTTWKTLTDPNGTGVGVSGGDAVTVPAASGTWEAVWMSGDTMQSAKIVMQAKAPPAGA